MADFYIERVFATLSAADERAVARRLEASARAYPVHWRKCLVDCARARIVCHLEAENLPAARAAALSLGVPRDDIWLSAVPWSAATGGVGEAGLVDVLGEWRLHPPLEARSLLRSENPCVWCLETQRVERGPVVASADGRRVVAFFRAPDAEAVRNAYRHAPVPFERVTALRRLER